MLTVDAPRSAAAIKPDRRPHAVVIGSGFGGLAAAIRLGARGYRVTVLEQLERPAGGPTSTGRTASPSTPARPSSPRRSSSRSCGSSAGAGSPTTSSCAPVTPFYRIRFDDGETFDYSGDRQRCWRRSRASRRPTSPATSASCASSEEIFRVGFEKLGHVPFGSLDGHAAHPARPAPAARAPQRLRRWSPPISATSGCARSSASIRC